MPRINFYLLRTTHRQQREGFVCRLVDKIWLQGHKIYIHTQHQAQAMMLDKLLWTFQDSSFIPHDLYPEPNISLAPVRIGFQNEYWKEADVLINLNDNVPGFFAQADRVLEVLNEEAQVKALGRERYRAYREAGFTPEKPIEIGR